MRTLTLLAFLAAGAAASHAATLTLTQPALSGLPDATVGWGFNIQSTPIVDGGNTITPWLLITFADFVPDPGSFPVGVFTPFITQLPNSNTVVGPDAGNGEVNPWSQSFNDALTTGIGSYHINDFQSPGDSVTGAVQILYDLYRVSPNDPSFNPGTDIIAIDQMLSARSSVAVLGAAETPEPGAVWSVSAGLLLCFTVARWRRASR